MAESSIPDDVGVLENIQETIVIPIEKQKCGVCKTKFSSFYHLQRHIRNVHKLDPPQNSKTIKCPRCTRWYSTKASILRHFEKYHNTKEKFTCTECDLQFPTKLKLARHMTDEHKVVPMCSTCNRKFKTVYILQRHEETVHPKPMFIENQFVLSKSCFECDKCKRTFPRKDGLLGHREICYRIGHYECHDCGKICLSKGRLQYHIFSVHNADDTNKGENRKCLLCHKSFKTSRIVEEHLETDHNIKMMYEQFEFASFSEFECFLKQEPFTQFFKSNCWQTETQRVRIYRCHRCGTKPAQKTVRKRLPKIRGSKKLDGYCPMYIKTVESKLSGRCSVTCQTVHVGHSICEEELQYMSLKMPEKVVIATKLKMGVPLSTILDEYRTARLDNAANWLSVLKNCDVANVASKYQLNNPYPAPFDDDAMNVRTFVDECADSVLYFKPAGCADAELGRLRDDDFALALMDASQERLLRRYARKLVAFDSAATRRRLTLHTMLVADVNRECVPVAFLLTNSGGGSGGDGDDDGDRCAVDVLLECVKRRVGVVETQTVLTNMQPLYHERWLRTMGPVPHLLYCAWHVRETWRRNLSKIADKEKRRAVVRALNDLACEPDAVRFETKLSAFLDDGDVDLRNFVQFFGANYAACKAYWAYCYRSFADADANMHLGGFYKTLRSQIADAKQSKTFYACLCMLKEYLLIKETEIAQTNIRGKLSHAQTSVRRRHKKALDAAAAGPVLVECVDEGVWRVETSPPNDGEDVVVVVVVADRDDEDDGSRELYVVSRRERRECGRRADQPCQLYCPKCRICSHEFACTCPDSVINNSMCKHVHLIALGGHYEPPKPDVDDVAAANESDGDVNDVVSVVLGNEDFEEEEEDDDYKLNTIYSSDVNLESDKEEFVHEFEKISDTVLKEEDVYIVKGFLTSVITKTEKFIPSPSSSCSAEDYKKKRRRIIEPEKKAVRSTH